MTTLDEFLFIEDSIEAMQELAGAGFQFIVISNQAGIARGLVDAKTVASINKRMVDCLRALGIDIRDVYVCPHHPDAGCNCRKPQPGLFYRAAREHGLDLQQTVYIGDDPRDAAAARNAGCRSVLIGPERDVMLSGGDRATFTSATLGEAVPWILSNFGETLVPCEHSAPGNR